MTMLRDLIEIPERVHAGDFVLNLSAGITQPSTVRDYVVTPQVADAFDDALGLIKSAVETRASRAAYLDGSFGSGKSHFPVSRAMRDVLLGYDVPATLTGRAQDTLGTLREDLGDTAGEGETLITRSGRGDIRWWTWAGHRANATLKTTLGDVAGTAQRVADTHLRLRDDLDLRTRTAALREASERLCLPHVEERALEGLKFSAALPRHLAEATLAARGRPRRCDSRARTAHALLRATCHATPAPAPLTLPPPLSLGVRRIGHSAATRAAGGTQ